MEALIDNPACRWKTSHRLLYEYVTITLSGGVRACALPHHTGFSPCCGRMSLASTRDASLSRVVSRASPAARDELLMGLHGGCF